MYCNPRVIKIMNAAKPKRITRMSTSMRAPAHGNYHTPGRAIQRFCVSLRRAALLPLQNKMAPDRDVVKVKRLVRSQSKRGLAMEDQESRARQQYQSAPLRCH